MKDRIDAAIKNGDLFFIGTKLPEDFYSGLLEWNDIAENKKDPKAYYNIAYCYRTGEGASVNRELAAQYYVKALNSGLKESLSQLFKIYIDDKVIAELSLFNKKASLEKAEKFKLSLEHFHNMIIESTKKGHDQLKDKIDAIEELLEIINLHINFLKGHESFHKACSDLASQGKTWALQILHGFEGKLIKLEKYRATKDTHSVIKDGNTAYVDGKKYYKVQYYTYYFNPTSSDVRVFSNLLVDWVTVKPGEKALITSTAPIPSQDSNRIDPYASNSLNVKIFDFTSIYRELGLSLLGSIEATLPVEKQKEVEEIPISPFNKLGILVGIVILFLTFYLNFR